MLPSKEDQGNAAMGYKSFFDTERRHADLGLVKQFVHSEAEEDVLGEKGSFIAMHDVGPVFNGSRLCSIRRFIEVGNDLEVLHAEGKTHGDISGNEVLCTN